MHQLGDRFLVERMVDGVVAELLVGIQIDAPVGWTLTIGSGGILAELVADTVTLLLPTTEPEIDDALRSLAVDKLLNGYRGGPAANRAATVKTIAQLAHAATSERIEIEINPLIATPTQAVAVDVLMEELT